MQRSSYHILPGDRKADAAGCVPYLKIKKRRLSACMEGWISERRGEDAVAAIRVCSKSRALKAESQKE